MTTRYVDPEIDPPSQLAVTEAALRAAQEREALILDTIGRAQKELRSTQENWREQCLFDCDELLTQAIAAGVPGSSRAATAERLLRALFDSICEGEIVDLDRATADEIVAFCQEPE